MHKGYTWKGYILKSSFDDDFFVDLAVTTDHTHVSRL